MRRDRLTFAMMVGIPLVQLLLFGFAINTDPKHLPTAVLIAGRQRVHAHASARRCRTAATSTSSRASRARPRRDDAARARRGAVRRHDPGELQPRPAPRRAARRCWSRPTPPTPPRPATRSARCAGSSTASFAQRPRRARSRRSRRRRRRSSCASTAATTPRRSPQYNIVPGLMGVILTMTMVMMTALAITRERERGTMENLLVDAGAAARGDARQDRAVHRRRLRAGRR